MLVVRFSSSKLVGEILRETVVKPRQSGCWLLGMRRHKVQHQLLAESLVSPWGILVYHLIILTFRLLFYHYCDNGAHLSLPARPVLSMVEGAA